MKMLAKLALLAALLAAPARAHESEPHVYVAGDVATPIAADIRVLAWPGGLGIPKVITWSSTAGDSGIAWGSTTAMAAANAYVTFNTNQLRFSVPVSGNSFGFGENTTPAGAAYLTISKAAATVTYNASNDNVRFTGAGTAFGLRVGNTGTFVFDDGTNTLATVFDDGTTGSIGTSATRMGLNGVAEIRNTSNTSIISFVNAADIKFTPSGGSVDFDQWKPLTGGGNLVAIGGGAVILQNAGVTVAQTNASGFAITGAETITGGADITQMKIICNATQTTNCFQVFKSDGTTNVVFAQATTNGGKLQLGGSPALQFNVQSDGQINSGSDPTMGLYLSGDGGKQVEARGDVTDAASKKAVVLNNGVTITNATAEIVSVQNNNTEKLSIGLGGNSNVNVDAVASLSGSLTLKSLTNAGNQVLVLDTSGTTVMAVGTLGDGKNGIRGSTSQDLRIKSGDTKDLRLSSSNGQVIHLGGSTAAGAYFDVAQVVPSDSTITIAAGGGIRSSNYTTITDGDTMVFADRAGNTLFQLTDAGTTSAALVGGTLTIGAGTGSHFVTQFLTQGYVIDFGAFTAGVDQTSAQAMTGVAFGDACAVGTSVDQSATIGAMTVLVTSAGNIKISVSPISTASTANPASATYTVSCWR